jgi:hypothetical protein
MYPCVCGSATPAVDAKLMNSNVFDKAKQQNRSDVVASNAEQERLHRMAVPIRRSGRHSMIVKECVPFSAPLYRAALSRISYINKPDEALSLPWIERLPGEKRIQFLYGQLFVVQHYLSCRLARAHLYHDDTLSPDSPDRHGGNTEIHEHC